MKPDGPKGFLPEQLPRTVTDTEIASYYRDGATLLRGIVDLGWIELIAAAIDRILAEPGEYSSEYEPAGARGRYYGDFFTWRRDPDVAAFMRDSALPELAARVMDAREVRFFYDQLLVKEPGTAAPTPWHQDLPYWPLRGSQILSIWVPFDPVAVESGGVQYLAGSHLWGERFAPATFGEATGFADVYSKTGLEPLPNIEAERHLHRILSWKMAPGDVLVHHPLTLHYASGNASASGRRRGLALRYIGEDVVWDTRPGTFLQHQRFADLHSLMDFADGAALSGELFPVVWPR